MAEAVSVLAQIVVPPFINPVIQKLLDGWLEKRQLKEELEKEIGYLSLKTKLINEFLQDADNKQGKNKNVQEWLKELKTIYYDAEDILDGYATDVAIQKMETEHNRISHASITRERRAKVSSSFSCCFTSQSNYNRPKSHYRLKVAKEIKSINEKLCVLLDTASSLNLNKINEPNPNLSLEGRKTTWLPDDFPIEGRDGDKEMLIAKLLNELEAMQEKTSHEKYHSSNRCTSIFPIVGMGGLGKTTLAKMIFNDDKINSYFGSIRAWVCVSDNSTAEDLIVKIIDIIYHSKKMERKCNFTDLGILQKELIEQLEGCKFLLILDDIWTEDIKIWEPLLKTIKVVKKGFICVIITTRYLKIGEIIEGCQDPLYIQGLEEEEVWKILHWNAFKGDNKNKSSDKQLESIGREIVKRLKGSPLAAKSIGSLLSSNCTIEFWRDVCESELWKLKLAGDEIFSILMLSYQYLSPPLKQCLLFFSLFPKDRSFEPSEMIFLWMAHGIIQSENVMTRWDVGEMYFKTLVDRSFLEHDRHYEGYSMHDLVHDLVLLICKYDCCFLSDGIKKEEETSSLFIHVSFLGVKDDNVIKHMCDNISNYRRMRTMLLVGNENVGNIYDMVGWMFNNLCHLRVLWIQECKLVSLPKSIGKLKHLRLLQISEVDVNELPESLGNLYNLLVLDLRGCEHLKGLPGSITRLFNLRHLKVYDDKLISSIKRIGQLSKLQSSVSFSIRDKKGFHISELQDLNFLEDRLSISNLQLVRNKTEAQQARLDKKEYLRDLRLKWTSMEGEDKQCCPMEEEVLEALRPCRGLNKVEIYGYKGSKLAKWLDESWLRSLKTLVLRDCINLNRLPPDLGRMQFLEEIYLRHLPSVKEIGWETVFIHGGESSSSSSCQFPALKSLRIEDMPELVEWWVGGAGKDKRADSGVVDGFPLLETLDIGDCPNLACLHFLANPTSLLDMRVTNCRKLERGRFPPAPTAFDTLELDGGNEVTQIWLGVHDDRWRGSWDIELHRGAPQFCSSSSEASNTRADEAHGILFPLASLITHLRVSSMRWEKVFPLLVGLGTCVTVHPTRLTIKYCPDFEHFEQ